jgi:hypothetical protein
MNISDRYLLAEVLVNISDRYLLAEVLVNISDRYLLAEVLVNISDRYLLGQHNKKIKMFINICIYIILLKMTIIL